MFLIELFIGLMLLGHTMATFRKVFFLLLFSIYHAQTATPYKDGEQVCSLN